MLNASIQAYPHIAFVCARGQRNEDRNRSLVLLRLARIDRSNGKNKADARSMDRWIFGWQFGPEPQVERPLCTVRITAAAKTKGRALADVTSSLRAGPLVGKMRMDQDVASACTRFFS